MPLTQDYLIESKIPPPAGYPDVKQPDEYSISSFNADYEARRNALLDYIIHNPSQTNPKAIWNELVRLATGNPFHMGVIDSTLDYIIDLRDCSDFALHALLRLIYQYKDIASTHSVDLIKISQTVLGFKYWHDEPGEDTMCTWTESHYILFASGAFLAGQYFPDETFLNSGLTGRELLSKNRPRILRWMALRFYTGFSEWLSNVHYDEDLTALVNLVDFSEDEEIRQRAAIIIDLLLLDMALNSFRGVFGSTHGCSYEDSKKWANQESTTDTFKLLFGIGVFSSVDNMSAIAFALSTRYQLPKILYEIANDQHRLEMLNRQRMGIEVSQARWWGLSPNKSEDAMHLVTMGAYLHPKFANRFINLLNTFNWWQNPFFQFLTQHRSRLKFLRATGFLPVVSCHYKRDFTRYTRATVNIYTYRTPDYMLSSAQDYQKGFGGDQQHLWQATLGPNAICFTTQPARTSGPAPNYWCGNGCNPRIAQIKNVLIAVYQIDKYPAIYVPNQLDFSHAWLPRDQFEEIHEQDGWIFARWGDGYLALLSQYPYEWQVHPGENQGREIIVKQRKNIWLCELGDKPNYGDFQAFIERMLQAEVRFFSNRHVVYQSPSQGQLSFGWKTPLRQDGRTIHLDGFPRYGNPYTQVAFPSDQIAISFGEELLQLDWPNGRRETGNFAQEMS